MAYARIGAKNIGLLMLPSFCKRCFWLEMQLWHNQAPFRFHPPAIINRLDRLQKRLVLEYQLNDPGADFPRWLGRFAVEGVGCEADVRISTEVNDLAITGILDFCFELVDETYGIVDGKTAYFKEGKDPLLPMYEVQLNVYAWLLSLVGKKASRAGFAYFEAQTDCEHPEKLVTKCGHFLGFHVVLHEIDLNWKKVVPPLLKRVQEIYALEKPPDPNPDCKNCTMLAQYTEIISGKQNKAMDMLVRIFLEDSQCSDKLLRCPSVMDLWDDSELTSDMPQMVTVHS